MAAFSIASLFGGGAPAGNNTPAAQPNQQQPAQQQAQQGQQGQLPAANASANSGVADPNNPAGAQGQQLADPFAQFSNMWEPPKPDENALTADKIIQFDPKQLEQTVRRMNFAGNAISPDTVQKILGGDHTALQTAFNTVAQNVMLQVTQSMSNMINGALGKHSDLMNSQMPEQMRRLMAMDGLSAAHPMLSNPAVAPIARALTSQLTKANPGKPASEIQSMVVDFLKATGSAFGENPAQPQAGSNGNNTAGVNDANSGANINWLEWGNGSPNFWQGQ